MPRTRPPFEQRLRRALASPDLPIALERSLSRLREQRARALSEVDYAALRADLTDRRRNAVDRLPELVARFTEVANAAGARVHYAADAVEARSIIGAIAQEHGVHIAVKSRSMAAEEIELTSYLGSIGVSTVETDLSEWILQLEEEGQTRAGSSAIPLSREHVAALINRVLGERVDVDDVDGIAETARLRLRQQFIEAGMGITGAQVAIAESGSVVLVSDEGNDRLAASLPPLHVTLLGIEALVPTLDDAGAELKLLSRSATGQKQASNVSFITGPSRSDVIDGIPTVGVHGPKEMHIVLLDNGRSGMRADAQFRDALRCIGCGACSHVCPPFSVVGDQAFGHIYSGPIGLVQTAWHHGVEAASGPQSLCFSCNACEPVCPVSIPVPRLILEVRELATRGKPQPLSKRVGMAVLEGPEPPRTGRRLLGRSLSRGSGLIDAAMRPASNWRRLPGVPSSSFGERLSRREREGAVLTRRQAQLGGAGAAGLRVAYFPDCMTNRFYPEIGEATVRLLQAAGAEVVVPPQTGCCGLTAYTAGERARAADLARAAINALRPARVDYVVASSSGCAQCIEQDYAHILRDDSGWQSRAAELAPRVTDLARFLDRFARFPAGSLRARRLTATYHDACRSSNCLGAADEGRRLVRMVAGGEIVEMADSSACCGFGGATSFEHPEVARRITDKKLTHIDRTGAPLVLADDAGCIMHLRGALQARGSSVRVQHLAEYLASALPSGKV